jgi:small-conductance mechanosensitive channel
VDDAESLLSQLTIAVHGALAAARIEIPFPQCDVHIRSGQGGRVGVLEAGPSPRS